MGRAANATGALSPQLEAGWAEGGTGNHPVPRQPSNWETMQLIVSQNLGTVHECAALASKLLTQGTEAFVIVDESSRHSVSVTQVDTRHLNVHVMAADIGREWEASRRLATPILGKMFAHVRQYALTVVYAVPSVQGRALRSMLMSAETPEADAMRSWCVQASGRQSARAEMFGERAGRLLRRLPPSQYSGKSAKDFRIEDPEEINAFLKDHLELMGELRAIADAIRTYFENCIPRLSLVRDPDSRNASQLVIRIPTDGLSDAASRLQQFDEEWWIDRPISGTSLIVVDLD